MRAVIAALPILVGVALLVYAVMAHRTAARLRRQRAELRELVNRLKDMAWDQRELDSHLSTIVIDEIRTYEKRELDT